MARMALYLAPMYFANSSAMILGGKTPIDLGTKIWDGNRLFGRGKTFRGFIAGVAVGTSVAAIISALFPVQTAELTGNYIMLGLLLSLGAITGDLAASFLKRRVGMEPGKEVLFLDQLDFLAGGIAFAAVIYIPTLLEIAAYASATLIVHRLSNYVAFRTNLKRVPW